MATPIQQNLQKSNEAYAANFTQGDLALPPAKKYAVGTLCHAATAMCMMKLTG